MAIEGLQHYASRTPSKYGAMISRAKSSSSTVIRSRYSQPVPQVEEHGEQDEVAEDCAGREEARVDEVGAGSVAPSLARVPHRPGKWRRAVRCYYTWAQLLRRVFRVEIFTCPNCGVADYRYSKQRSKPAEPSHGASNASNCCIAARRLTG